LTGLITDRCNSAAIATVVMALDRDVKNLRVDHLTLRHTMLEAVDKTRLIMNDISQRVSKIGYYDNEGEQGWLLSATRRG